MYIYKITNLINNKCYTGQHNGSVNYYFGSGTLIKRAVKKYGKSNFKKEIITKGNFNKELLNELEKHFIRIYSPKESKNSYNLTDGGEGVNGYIPTKEHILNMSIAAKERMKNPKERLKAGNGSRGKTRVWSKERRKNNQKIMKGNKWGYLNKGKPKPILQINLDGSLFKEWESIKKAGLESGISDSSIETGLRTNKKSRGYFWKYK